MQHKATILVAFLRNRNLTDSERERGRERLRRRKTFAIRYGRYLLRRLSVPCVLSFSSSEEEARVADTRGWGWQCYYLRQRLNGGGGLCMPHA